MDIIFSKVLFKICFVLSLESLLFITKSASFLFLFDIWLDIIFSNKKYNNIHYVENGGWHFTNIKSPENLEKKFLNFLHHQEFEASGLKLDNIKEMVKNKKIIYDLDIDQKNYKWKGTKSLNKVPLSSMPDYLYNNYKKYSNWLEI